MFASVITLVNNPSLYKSMVLDSLDPKFFEFISIPNPKYATIGLNEGLKKATCDLCILCHQDVSFPKYWILQLASELNKIEDNFGCVGTFGIVLKDLQQAGNIFNPKPVLKVRGILPAKAIYLDEHCLIMKKSSGFMFDESFTGFHMYGGDICLAMIEKGLNNYIIDSGGLNHLSNGNFDDSFFKSSQNFQKKWKGNTKIKKISTMWEEIDLE